MALSEGNREILDNKVEAIQDEFNLDDNQLKKIIRLMQTEMKKGLTNRESGSSIKMLLSYVCALPSGSERGHYIALDLGGTNFRVLLIHIKDDEEDEHQSKIEILNEIFTIPDDVKVGDAESFFDHIAKCLATFCQDNGLSDMHLPIGFTFSFGLKKESLTKGILVSWSKGFDVPGVVGEDVVGLLHKAIKKRGDLNCEVVAVLNDAVGTLMSCAHDEPDCLIGLIIGTGTNACYMEKVSNISGIEHSKVDSTSSQIKSEKDSKDQMCINMEWGGFGDNGVLSEFRNEFDKVVDSESNNKVHHLFEKMISGKYMGEMVRLVLCKLTLEGGLFHGKGSDALFTPNSFHTAFVSEIEKKARVNNMDPDLVVKNILGTLGIVADEKDCAVVRQVCSMISTRAAHLCAAGVAAVALKIKENHSNKETMEIVVGVDGTVYKRHPTFSILLKQKTNELCAGSGMTVKFEMSFDGSGKGAALVAAAATRNNVGHVTCMPACSKLESA